MSGFSRLTSHNTKAIAGTTIQSTSFIILKSMPATNNVIHNIARSTRLAEREGCFCINITGITTVIQTNKRVGS